MNNKDASQHECLFVLDLMGIGGSERKIVSVANGLAQRGYKVHLFFLNFGISLTNTIDKTISITVLQRKGKLDRQVIKKLRQYMLEHNGIKTIWPVNLYPLLYVFLATRGIENKPLIIGSSNKTLFRSFYQEAQMLLYTPIIRSLDCFIFGSYNQKEMWIKKYFLGNKNYHVIHNGVDIDKFSITYRDEQRPKYRTKFGYSKTDIVIGMVARFSAEKAHDDLINACKRLIDQGIDIKLLLAGDGLRLEEIKQLCLNLGISERVTFAGSVDDVRPFLVCMDIFALTSISVETFSNAALEAMAMKLPIVISDLSGAKEMVEDGVNGYTYPPGNVDKLANSLSKLMKLEDRVRLGETGRQILEKKFTRDIMIETYRKFIWPDRS
ncbi:MAG: glycosyltransferase family 4 protein [Pseudomonadota bacterium]